MFNDTVVHRVQQHKHLGFWLDSNLTFRKQVHEVCTKANAKLAVLRSVRFLSRATLDLLYKLTVRSVIDYGLMIHFHSLRQTDIARLTQLQYRAAKLVTGALHLTSRDKLDAELGWENLSTRAEFLGLSLFHKIRRGETRPLVRTCMPTFNLNPRNTRNPNPYNKFPAKLGYKFSNSFFPHFTKSFNNLPDSLQNEPDHDVFKEKLKLELKPKKTKTFFLWK